MQREAIAGKQVQKTRSEVGARAGTMQLAGVTRGEWFFVLITALLLLLITTLPYLFGFLLAPADMQFMGIMVNVPDHVQYFSWMRELTTAHLAANMLTPEPNAPVFFNLLWWGMGRLGNVLGLDYAAMFQLMRWVATILCLLLIYRMISFFFTDRLRRRTAFLVAVFGAGLGWLLVVGKYTVTNGELLWPLDLYVAEPNTFYSILAFPHFIAALLYIGVFILALHGEATRQWRYPVLAGLFALFMGWQHAYDLLIVYGVLGAWTLLVWARDRQFPRFLFLSCLIIGVISVTPALYSVLLTSLDPLWEEVLAQFANAGVYTPPLYRLPVLLGIPFLLALYAAISQKPWKLAHLSTLHLFLHGWFWISFVLVYLPTDYQIHMLNGWQIPIAILATMALFDSILPAVQRWRAQRGNSPAPNLSKWLAALLILLVIPTNLYLFAWRFVELNRHEAPYYLYKDEIAALEWLEQNAATDDVVMASLTLGQYVPALTGTHAFLAHWAQTVDFYVKRDQVNAFYADSTSAAERRQIVDEFGVDYVIAGPSEKQIGDYAPTPAEGFAPVFQQGDVTIYAVDASLSSTALPGLLPGISPGISTGILIGMIQP